MQTAGHDEVFHNVPGDPVDSIEPGDPDDPLDQGDPVEPLGPARGRLTLVFLIVIALGLVLARSLGDPGPDGSGSTLTGFGPEIVMASFDGTEWRLSEHLTDDGRPVVLNLWASWCIPCRDEIPELSAFADARPDIAVIGVSVDQSESEARAMADELQPRYPVGMDSTNRIRERYPSVGMPFTVVIDRQGTIRWSKAGGVTASELERATAG
jgi:cytochrome c biogenesis protein CcmG/thiol:disulfide interchange protein DsbE